MKIAALLSTALLAVIVSAQPDDPAMTLDRLLTGITVDARAIEDGNLSIYVLQALANEIWNYAHQVPFYAADIPSTEVILVDLRRSAASLVDRAQAQDNLSAARDARDLLDQSFRLRQAAGLTP